MADEPKALLVPFPLDPLRAFGYFLYRKFKVVSPNTYIRYSKATLETGWKRTLGDGAVICLPPAGLYEHLDDLIYDHAYHTEAWIVDRLLTFCNSSNSRSGQKLRNWIIKLSLASDNPKTILENIRRFFEECVERRIDLWCKKFDVDELLAQWRFISGEKQSRTISVPPDTCFLSLPVLKKYSSADPAIGAVVKQTAPFSLREGNAWMLTEAHLSIGVGGPPGSGKSTLAKSLATQMDYIVRSLQTRPHWKGFQLQIRCIDLDKATPTSDIIGFEKQDPAVFKSLKRPWSMSLATEALENFRDGKSRTNVVIGDLPGQITAITEMVGALADMAIIITNDKSKISEWRDFFQMMGIQQVGEARSRLPEEGKQSLITTYYRGDFIAGDVVGLNRVDQSYDSFIFWLAEILLFDILPTFISTRRKKLERMLTAT